MTTQVLDTSTFTPYGDASYWDVRYNTEMKKYGQHVHSFDWHETFDTVWNIISTFLEGIKDPQSKRILVVGCGNSTFSERLYKEGYTNITNIDISAVVIEQMQQKYSGLEGLEFVVMDVRKMDSYPNSSFDIVIDKGTIDTLFAGYDFINDVPQTLQEICRLMTPGGLFFCISHGSATSRCLYLRTKKLKWRLESLPIGTNDIMLYAMTKYNMEDNHEDEGATHNACIVQERDPSQSFGAPLIRKKEDAGRIVLGKVRDDENLPQLSRSIGFILPVPLRQSVKAAPI